MLERRVVLRGRHGSGVEPGVEDGRQPTRCRVAVLDRAGEGDVVDGRAMEVEAAELAPGQPLELGHRADAGVVALTAAPDRQRRAPIPVAREGPVHVALQPLAEAAVLDVFRVPADALVLPQEVVLTGRRAHEPRRLGPVQQRRPAPPAVGVAVLVRLLRHQEVPAAEVGDDLRIGVLHVAPGPRDDAIVERAVRSHRIDDREPFLPPDERVGLAEGRCQVDETRAFVGLHEVRGHDPRATVVDGQQIERSAIAPAHQVLPCPGLGHLRLRPSSDRGRRSHHEVAAAIGRGDAHVADVGANGDGHVRNERPRRRGPHHEVDLAIDDGEAHEHRRIDHLVVDVRLAELVRRQGGAAAGAVGRDPMALVEQSGVPELPHEPPDRLDVVVAHRPIGVLGVEPDAGPVGQRDPVLHVARHRFPAPLVERGHAVRLDLLLRAQPQLLLDLDLHRQAVAVPAGLPGDGVATHRLEPGVEVLEDPRPDVVEPWAAVRGRRPLVEDPRRRIGPPRPDLAEQIFSLPARQHLLLEHRQIQGGIDRAVRHRRSVGGGPPAAPGHSRARPRGPRPVRSGCDAPGSGS